MATLTNKKYRKVEVTKNAPTLTHTKEKAKTREKCRGQWVARGQRAVVSATTVHLAAVAPRSAADKVQTVVQADFIFRFCEYTRKCFLHKNINLIEVIL